MRNRIAQPPRRPIAAKTAPPATAALLGAGLLMAACSPAAPPPAADRDPGPATEAAAVRRLDPPAGAGAMAPGLSAVAGAAVLTWLEPAADGRGTVFYLAELRGQRWSPARRIAAGEAFFANWADLPAAAQSAGGTLFAHWLDKLGADTYAYGAELARSHDGGHTWEALGLLHDDASPTEHGFVSYAPLPAGGVQAFWLDGRRMLAGGAMQLRTVRLEEAGPGDAAPAVEMPAASTLLDERVCECCSTDAAMTAAGPLVAYRDRGPDEIRDIAVARATAEGWSGPTVIHDDGWRIHGCPVNGPAVAAAGERVAVAWFTGAPRARVAVAFSDDSGAAFAPPITVDDDRPLGRVDVVLGRRGEALVSWLGSAGEGAEIRWRRVTADGERGPVGRVATTSVRRAAGVPRMLRHGDGLLIAWVEDAEPSRLRAGLVALAE